jgi:hypothetical protein
MLTTTADTLARKLKTAKQIAESQVIINGEIYDKAELKQALKDGLCNYSQSRCYYGFVKVSDEVKEREMENWESMQSRTWQGEYQLGVMIGDKFYKRHEAILAIKAALKKLNSWCTIATINGEDFTAKELRYALAHDCCDYMQTKRDFDFVASYNDEYKAKENFDAMRPQKWCHAHKKGIVFGGHFNWGFQTPQEAEKIIRKALKATTADTVSILDVTVPYEPFKELCQIWGTERINISNGTSTQIKFNVPKHNNTSTILAKEVSENDLVIKIEFPMC